MSKQLKMKWCIKNHSFHVRNVVLCDCSNLLFFTLEPQCWTEIGSIIQRKYDITTISMFLVLICKPAVYKRPPGLKLNLLL